MKGRGSDGKTGGKGGDARPIDASFSFTGGAIVVTEPTHEPLIFPLANGNGNKLTMEANGG